MNLVPSTTSPSDTPLVQAEKLTVSATVQVDNDILLVRLPLNLLDSA